MGTHLIFGPGSLDRLGQAASELGFCRALLVSDPELHGMRDRAATVLLNAGVSVHLYSRFGSNPDSTTVEAGRDFASELGIDSIVALGGGSALDAARAINFLVTNGGRMQDYRGYGKAKRPLLPSIGIPTTAGTGSEAQSYCVIADADTNMKMACGDPSAAFRVAILDPDLVSSAPKAVRAAAGIDAAAHAIETLVTKRRSPLSQELTRAAWKLIGPALLEAIDDADNVPARTSMLLGAHFAGAAIDASMLGAAHACANPLTARYGTTHGVALGILVPHVVRWNAEAVAKDYEELGGADAIVSLIEKARAAAKFPSTLRDLGAKEADLEELAMLAATQWTGTFNPREMGAAGAMQIYKAAY